MIIVPAVAAISGRLVRLPNEPAHGIRTAVVGDRLRLIQHAQELEGQRLRWNGELPARILLRRLSRFRRPT